MQERSPQVQETLTGDHKPFNAGGLSVIDLISGALIERLCLLCELLGSVVRTAFFPRSAASLVAVLSSSLMQ